MRRWTIAVTLTLTVAAVGLSLAQSQPAPSEKYLAPREWMSDYGQARRESRRLGLPLIVHFYTDWCAPCRRMDREFLETPAMREVLGEKFVGVKLNGEKHQWLANHFYVKGYPSDFIVAPDSRILQHTVGGRSKSQYFEMLSQTRQQNLQALQKARALALAQLKPSTPIASTRIEPRPLPGTERPATASPGPGSTGTAPVRPLVADRSPLVGLDGYSPVTISAKRQWVRGRKDLAVTYQGVVYYLASEVEHRKFRQAPRKFAPKMLGCDPVELWRSDRAVQGSVQYGAFFDQQLYLFVSSDTRNEFKRDPMKYVRSRHAIHADDVSGTRLR